VGLHVSDSRGALLAGRDAVTRSRGTRGACRGPGPGRVRPLGACFSGFNSSQHTGLLHMKTKMVGDWLLLYFFSITECVR